MSFWGDFLLLILLIKIFLHILNFGEYEIRILNNTIL